MKINKNVLLIALSLSLCTTTNLRPVKVISGPTVASIAATSLAGFKLSTALLEHKESETLGLYLRKASLAGLVATPFLLRKTVLGVMVRNERTWSRVRRHPLMMCDYTNTDRLVHDINSIYPKTNIFGNLPRKSALHRASTDLSNLTIALSDSIKLEQARTIFEAKPDSKKTNPCETLRMLNLVSARRDVVNSIITERLEDKP